MNFDLQKNFLCPFDLFIPPSFIFQGDSGGPLNVEGEGRGRLVVGITSWGIQGGGVCLVSYPSIYTRTSNFVDWIINNAQ